MAERITPAFFEIGDKFVSLHDYKSGVDTVTDYYYNQFLKSREEASKDETEDVLRSVFYNGLERIEPGDDMARILWAGYIMGIRDQKTEEENRLHKVMQ